MSGPDEYSLKKRFEKCKAENNVSPSWLSFDDIPSKGTRSKHDLILRLPGSSLTLDTDLFKKEYPYFFLLRELLIPSTPVTSILPKQHPIASSSQPATPDSLPVVPLFGPSRRPKKRPLPVDSSDSAGSSSDDDKNAGDSDCSSEDERFTPSALPSPTIPSLAPVIKPNIHNPPVSTPIATGAAQPSKRPRTSQSSSLEEPHAVKVEKPTPPSTSMVDKGKARMSVILGRPVARPSSSGMGTGKTKGSTVADAIEVADDDMNSSDDDGVSDEDSKSSDSKSSESKSVEDGSAAGSMGVDAEDEDQEVDACGWHGGPRERSELGTAAGESSGLIDDNSLVRPS